MKQNPMNKFLKSMLVVVLALFAMNATGAAVDVTAAQASASRFVKSHASRGALMAPGLEIQLSYIEKSVASAADADYYVFNASDGSAFVIVAGDDRAEEILGFGEGTLDMNALPCNLQWLFNTYKEQMEYLHANPAAVVQRAAPYNDVTIAPMVTCNWSQRAPYNNMCPAYEGELSVTGCVATAMAQVMYYWKYPAKTPTLSGYTTRTHRISLPSLPSKPLDWDNMLDSYLGDYTQEQGDAVALLMRYCGQSSQMDYSPTGSGTYVRNQLQGMRSFGYSYEASMLDRPDYSIEEWDAMMQEDLLAGRPILYSGADALAGGHAFVLDGYYDGKYHINWGWGGTGDGYFMLGAFSVRGYSFTTQQQMLHCVHPSTMAEPEDGYDFEADGIYYMYNEDATGLLVTYKDTQYGTYHGDVAIPASVTHDGETLDVVGIGQSAFRNCSHLTSVSIPVTVRSIERHAFRNCINLHEIVLPQGVTSIGAQAFAYCYQMKRVQLPLGLERVGERAFVDCSALERVESPSLAAWLGITFADALSNPLSGAHHLFVDGEEVTELQIPAAFVDQIGPYAFNECTALTKVAVAGVKTIGRAAFMGCTGITELSLDTSLEEIGNEAFSGCTGLTSVTIPASIKRLSNSLFASCTGLKTVEIPTSVVSIEGSAFTGCTKLDAVSLPASVTSIGASAFNGCTRLTQLELPESLTSIGSSAFNGCSKLTSVIIPNSVTSLGENAFNDCSALTTLVISDSLSTISNEAFANCSALKSVTIPDGVNIIGNQAFYKCLNLVNITLGSGVQEIGKQAFDNNYKIKTITSMASVPPLMASPDRFDRSIYTNATLRVPVAYVKTYKHTGVWSWFTKVEGILGVEDADVNGDGEITVADVNLIVAAILSRSDSDACDVNGDGEITVADVNAVISFIIAGKF